MDLPYITADLPGVGGQLRTSDDDFIVEEIPAYTPCGEGDHVYAWVEKRGLTTFHAVEALATATGVRAADVGSAGLKDRHAVTKQWLSFPAPATPDILRDVEVEGVRVLEVQRHRNKLKTGHLRGNRFQIRIRSACQDALPRASAILERLISEPGSPNWFGEQRFGARGDNAERGRALVLGQALPGRPIRGRKKRLLISAYQAHLFNEYLRQRIADGQFRAQLEGEVLRGGVPSGPIFGWKTRPPDKDTAAAKRELALLTAEGIELTDFKRVGKLALGTRRPIAVELGEPRVTSLPDNALEVSFDLPAGSYATVVLREIIKPQPPVHVDQQLAPSTSSGRAASTSSGQAASTPTLP